jgi:hypothetical protein
MNNPKAIEDILTPEIIDTIEMMLNTVVKKNDQIKYLRVYPEGFVPNSYRYRAPGTRILYSVDTGEYTTEGYDRKRSRGAGPCVVCMNKQMHTIHSWK